MLFSNAAISRFLLTRALKWIFENTAREIVKKLSPSPRIAALRARTRKAESAVCLASSPDKRSLVEKADNQKRQKKTTAVRTAGEET
ncbi:hypothetical protein LSAT2_007720 [Lamellibrachia satsuma]|nr:hypothetical protein LSAT2_007720 [Lamellibrachia satsuma]